MTKEDYDRRKKAKKIAESEEEAKLHFIEQIDRVVTAFERFARSAEETREIQLRTIETFDRIAVAFERFAKSAEEINRTLKGVDE